MDWYFDKRTTSVLRYICKHPGVNEGELLERFEDCGGSQLLISLSINDYLIAQNENGQFYSYKADQLPWKSSYKTRWYPTSKSNVVVEQKAWELWKWLVPLIFSALALFASIVNLALNAFC